MLFQIEREREREREDIAGHGPTGRAKQLPRFNLRESKNIFYILFLTTK
jgi:hypothetical protein